MPSLLDQLTIEAIENMAGRCSLDAEQAVVMVEALVADGTLAASVSAVLAPDAEARLSLRRFEGAAALDRLQPTPIEEL